MVYAVSVFQFLFFAIFVLVTAESSSAKPPTADWTSQSEDSFWSQFEQSEVSSGQTLGQQRHHQQLNNHVQQQQLAQAQALQSAFEVNRGLQERTLQNQLTSEFVCDSLNNMTTTTNLQCVCSDFGSDFQVDCTYVNPICDATNTTCYVGSIQQVLKEGIVGAPLQARVITTCTIFTTDPNRGTETCIRVFPFTDGDFDMIASCSVMYTPTGSDPRVCSSCTIWEDDNSSSENPRVSFDCCNLQTDVKQTCGEVANGLAIPFFDIIPESEKGQCTSTATAIFTPSVLVLFSFLLSLASVTVLD